MSSATITALSCLWVGISLACGLTWPGGAVSEPPCSADRHLPPSVLEESSAPVVGSR